MSAPWFSSADATMYIDSSALAFERHFGVAHYAGYWRGAWTGGSEAMRMLGLQSPVWRCVVDDFGSLVRVSQ